MIAVTLWQIVGVVLLIQAVEALALAALFCGAVAAQDDADRGVIRKGAPWPR